MVGHCGFRYTDGSNNCCFFSSVFSLIVFFVAVLRPVEAQLFTAVNGQCDPRAFYTFGTCRRNACLASETFLPGSSYCDVYNRVFTRYTGTSLVRCVTDLPCCVWGGQCRQSCNVGERRLRFESDCEGARRGVCCVNSQQTRLAPTPIRPGPLPLPSRQTSIARQQGRCLSNPVVSVRVLGGAPVPPVRWPWMVRLVYRGGQRAVCSGVLVDEDTVLTVAHCVNNGTQPQDVQIQVGDFDLSRREAAEDLIPVSSIFRHRDFQMGAIGHDFAILKLSRAARLGPVVTPACLPDPRVPLVTGRDARCFVAGWGVDDAGRVSPTLRAAPVVVINTNLCQTTMNAVIGSFRRLPPDVICTVSASRRDAGACLFDDGGMLACADTRGRYTFTGLVSQYSCGDLPTIYTRVDTYITSILSRL